MLDVVFCGLGLCVGTLVGCRFFGFGEDASRTSLGIDQRHTGGGFGIAGRCQMGLGPLS